MNCPACGKDKVVVLEVKEGETVTTRVYGCNNCTQKFMTVEKPLFAERRKA